MPNAVRIAQASERRRGVNAEGMAGGFAQRAAHAQRAVVN
jgi:hypothetical protein